MKFCSSGSSSSSSRSSKSRVLTKTVSNVSTDSMGFPRVLSSQPEQASSHPAMLDSLNSPKGSSKATTLVMGLGEMSPGAAQALVAAMEASLVAPMKKKVKEAAAKAKATTAAGKALAAKAVAKPKTLGKAKAKAKAKAGSSFLPRQQKPYVCRDGGEVALQQRLQLRPNGCCTCKFVPGCTPSCWKRRDSGC